MGKKAYETKEKQREVKALEGHVQTSKLDKKKKKKKKKTDESSGATQNKLIEEKLSGKKRKLQLSEDEKKFDKADRKEKRRKKNGEVSQGKEGLKENQIGEEGSITQQKEEERKHKKKKHKEKNNSNVVTDVEDKKMGEIDGQMRLEREDIAQVKNVEEGDEKTKKNKIKKRRKEGGNEEVEVIKKHKEREMKKKTKGREKGALVVGGGEGSKDNKANSDGEKCKGVRRTKTDVSENTKPTGIFKKVSFSDEVEVFPLPDELADVEEGEYEGVVQGKRFSPKEDMIIKEAVFNYIDTHGLGEEGLHMILHCRLYPEVKNCWKEIGSALPWRPSQSVYYRAHNLFERDETRTWTDEEYELVKNFHEQHGSDWKTLAEALGKHRFHVKDAWRRIKLPNRKRGHWSQEEYQNLFDLVNMDLCIKAYEEKKSKHGMLRDNICWGAISDKLSTRINSACCVKWYDQLTSPMVAEGIWDDADDYRLISALYSLDACCMEDVDWDNLLEHRSGDVCRKRWNQMHNHIGEHGNKTFAEQVEVLSKRYCPNLLEVREACDSRTVVP